MPIDTLIETEVQKYSLSLPSAPELDGLQQWDGAKLFRVSLIASLPAIKY